MRKQRRCGTQFCGIGSRKLRLESLESRQLLAADGCSPAIEPVRIAPVPIAAQEFATNLHATAIHVADAAGETLRTAADLGIVNGTLQRFGRLSWFDRADVIRFEITETSQVRIGLDQLNRDANLYVLDRNGKLIGSSTRPGSLSKALAGSLKAGEYFIGISSVSHRNISYRLTFDVQQTSSPEPAPLPAAPPSATSPAVTPPAAKPTTAKPLSEVPYFGGRLDWNVNAVGAPEAWQAGYRGQGVTVAVIDTGVDLDHPDLARNLYVNPGEIRGNGIDDDHNGLIDDISGYDFVSGDAFPDDGNGHGTHVAGTIAALNNGFGVTGIAPSAKILPIRVLDDSGSGTDVSVSKGIRYAAELGAQIINLSLGGSISARITEAINYATSLGSLVVAASGNESASTPSHPAIHSALSTGVVSVGAYDSSNQAATFSNRVGGSGAVQVDAPGVGIYSTYIGGGFRSLSGTSMASPHVAGVAALVLSAKPDLTPAALRSLLVGSTIGHAVMSDSIGMISTLNSVAFAAAGLSHAGGITSQATATATAAVTTTATGVHTTQEVAAMTLDTLAIGRHSATDPSQRTDVQPVTLDASHRFVAEHGHGPQSPILRRHITSNARIVDDVFAGIGRTAAMQARESDLDLARLFEPLTLLEPRTLRA